MKNPRLNEIPAFRELSTMMQEATAEELELLRSDPETRRWWRGALGEKGVSVNEKSFRDWVAILTSDHANAALDGSKSRNEIIQSIGLADPGSQASLEENIKNGKPLFVDGVRDVEGKKNDTVLRRIKTYLKHGGMVIVNDVLVCKKGVFDAASWAGVIATEASSNKRPEYEDYSVYVIEDWSGVPTPVRCTV